MDELNTLNNNLTILEDLLSRLIFINKEILAAVKAQRTVQLRNSKARGNK